MNTINLRWIHPKAGILTTCLIGLLSFSLNVVAQTTKTTTIIGSWLNQEKAAKIEISQQGKKFFGKIAWLREPYENGNPKTDNKNPDKSRHNDPIIGLVMLKNFEFDGKSTWEGGTIYDARTGKTYSSYMTLQADKTLKVRAYIGVSLLGQTTIWTRVN